MNTKNIIASLALAAGSAVAFAGPVLSVNKTTTEETSFQDVYTFTLSGSQTVSTRIETRSSWNCGLPCLDLSISSVTFSNGQFSYVFDPANDGTQLLLTEFGQKTVHNGKGSYEVYFGSYTLDPLLLGPGQWTMTIAGDDLNNKNNGSYAATLNVPEPQSLALSLTALAGLAFAARRQRRPAR